MKEDNRTIAANILGKVLSGEISPVTARTSWPEASGDALLDQAYHQLYHFEDDADIRARDLKYSEWQSAEMRLLIIELKGEKRKRD